MKIKIANGIAPDGTPRFAASHLGLFCLPMPHKKDTRLIWVYLINFLGASNIEGTEQPARTCSFSALLLFIYIRKNKKKHVFSEDSTHMQI